MTLKPQDAGAAAAAAPPTGSRPAEALYRRDGSPAPANVLTLTPACRDPASGRLPAADPLALALKGALPAETCWPAGEVTLEPLPASRPVYRFVAPGGNLSLVGKLFFADPPASSPDRGLLKEHENYRWAATLGLTPDSGRIPRLLGRAPEARLGLLLEDIPGPDLDFLLLRASLHGEIGPLYRGLENLAGLLASFHTRPLPAGPASSKGAIKYLGKIRHQLQEQGLLTAGDSRVLEEEGVAWTALLESLPDRQVLIHGDATPTNFLFPEGRAVALDLERLGAGDRLRDLSYVAGEMKHAWGWRTGNLEGAEPAIGHFFSAYLSALRTNKALSERLYRLNPFYMALAELRIARNDYLDRDYRLALIAEARRCLSHGRRMP
jgi:aminoglycoside phosphotransferase